MHAFPLICSARPVPITIVIPSTQQDWGLTRTFTFSTPWGGLSAYSGLFVRNKRTNSFLSPGGKRSGRPQLFAIEPVFEDLAEFFRPRGTLLAFKHTNKLQTKLEIGAPALASKENAEDRKNRMKLCSGIKRRKP